MSKIFTQTDTLAPCGVIQACAPVAPAADADAIQATAGGTPGVTALSVAIPTNSSVGAFQAELAIADADSLNAGNLVMRINVSTAQVDLTWEETYVCRLSSACASQETLGSATGLAINISAGGIFTAPALSLSAASAHNAGDKIYILIVVKNVNTHTSRTLAIIPDQNIDTPFVGATPTFKTVDANAVLKKQGVEVSTGSSSVLRSSESKTVSAGAVLKGSEIVIVGTDALFASEVALSVGTTAILKKSDVVLVNGNAVLRSSESKTVSAEAVLKGSEIVIVGTDALLVSGAALSVDTTAVLKQGVEVSTEGSSVLTATEVLSTNVNSILSKTESVVTSADSILQGAEVLGVGVTTVLQSQGVVVFVSSDSALQGAEALLVGVDSVFRKTETKTVGTSAELVSRQIAVPNADIQAGGWTPSTGVDLFPMVADGSDTTWIQSPSAPVNDTAELQLEAISTPEVGQVFLVIRHQLITV